MSDKSKTSINNNDDKPSSTLQLNVANQDGNNKNSRKKSELGKGYSLMDWIRYSKTNLEPSKRPPIIVTKEELCKHNKIDDCWIAIYDKVYDVTPYMKYHPGGIDELMKGAGILATDLFNEIHAWVNFQSMLEHCYIGKFVGNATKTTTKTTTSLQIPNQLNISLNTSSNKLPVITTTPPQLFASPAVVDTQISKLDSYQTNDKLFVVLYTKCKRIKNEYITIYKNENDQKELFVDLYLNDLVYEYRLELRAPVKDIYNVKCNKDGKIEITIFKLECINWNNVPNLIEYTARIIKEFKNGINYRKCELIKRTKVTHDTDIYTFKLPNGCRLCVPCGYHVFLKLIDDEFIIKPYTAVFESLLDKTDDELNGKIVSLMIKHYDDGQFTPKLRNLNIGDKLEISNFVGTFDEDRLIDCTNLICLCAGTGFTPFVKIINIIFDRQSEQSNKTCPVLMLFFNKTKKDILWHSQLDNLSKIYENRFKLVNILSQEENVNWNEYNGKINEKLLNELLPKNMQLPLICICGPSGFTQTAIELIKKLGYDSKYIHAFQG